MSSNNVATVTTNDYVIRYYWATDYNYYYYFVAGYVIMYVCSASPSVTGFLYQMIIKSFMNTYLLYDVITKVFTVFSLSGNYPTMYNFYNWLIYPVKRLIVEMLLIILLFITQLIPGLNWILNIVPIVLSYLNIFDNLAV